MVERINATGYNAHTPPDPEAGRSHKPVVERSDTTGHLPQPHSTPAGVAAIFRWFESIDTTGRLIGTPYSNPRNLALETVTLV